MKAETSPSSLTLGRQEVFIQDIFRTIRQYELLQADLDVLQEVGGLFVLCALGGLSLTRPLQRTANAKGRLDSLVSILTEPPTRGTQDPGSYM